MKPGDFIILKDKLEPDSRFFILEVTEQKTVDRFKYVVLIQRLGKDHHVEFDCFGCGELDTHTINFWHITYTILITES